MAFYLVFTVNHTLSFAFFIPFSLYNCFLLVRKRLREKSVSLWTQQVTEEPEMGVKSVLHELSIGVRPRDIDVLVCDNIEEPVDEKTNLYCDLFKYYCYLDQEDYCKAIDVFKLLEIRLRKTEMNLSEEELVTFKNELLYTCYLQGDVVKATKLYEEIINKKLTYSPINMPRALAAYHLLTTENIQTAQFIYKKASQQNHPVEKGLQQFEMDRAMKHQFISKVFH